MSRHSKADQPRTGDGHTSGQKPAIGQVVIKNENNVHLLRQTADAHKYPRPEQK